MNIEDTKNVLAACAAFDNRRPDPVALRVWSGALGDEISVEDAVNAVVEHYSQKRDWIMPSDVMSIWKRVRGERVYDEEQKNGPLIPAGLGDEPKVEMTWRNVAREAIRSGASRSDAEASAWAAIGRTPNHPEIEEKPTRNVIRMIRHHIEIAPTEESA